MSSAVTRRRLGWSLLALLGAFVAVALAGHRADGDASEPLGARAKAPRPLAALPDAPAPALDVPEPQPLAGNQDLARWSVIVRSTTARRRPSRTAVSVARLATRTPEQTANLVLVLGRRKDAKGRLWVRVQLPVLPNGTTGWVPRTALGGYGLVHTRLIVDLERFVATLLRDGEEVFRADVGVGRSRWPTPSGEFFIRNRLANFANPFYGPLAFGTSARSSVLTDWPAGGFVGIHGTNEPELIPGRISHGCIRMRNADIVRLGKLMPVGTPVTIR